MKRFLALMAAVAMTLSLTACGNTQDNGASQPDSGSTNQTTQQKPTVDNNAESNSTTNTKDVRTGVGVVISMDGTKGATESSTAAAKTEITVCAASFDSNGKILDVMFDAAEPGVEFDDTGALTTDISAGFKTKRQLGDSYGMKKVSGIGKEWYQQVDALQDWMIGKTAQEVLGMTTTSKNENEYADEEDLTSSVTIAVGEFLEALQMAYDNAQGGTMAGQSDQNSQSEQSSQGNQSSTSENAQ